jgi:hypothetical protein
MFMVSSMFCVCGEHHKCPKWYWGYSFDARNKIVVRERVECSCPCHEGDVYGVD